MSFWAWVWGTTGALLVVALLIILKTVLDAAGKPDIAGSCSKKAPSSTNRTRKRMAAPASGTRAAGRGRFAKR